MMMMSWCLMSSDVIWQGQVVTNSEARFNKSHMRKVYACFAVTCHLHFWQNDRDFLCATVVTRVWNGYQNKSQHRKSTLEKKILPPFQQGFEPATFQSRVRRSNHWAIPAPKFDCLKSELKYFFTPFKEKHGCHTWITNKGIKSTRIRNSVYKHTTYKCTPMENRPLSISEATA